MATQSSMSLQELIQEDFLTCKICYDLYVVPKILPCLHSYCIGCLDRLVQNGMVQCPECRLQTEVPEGAAGLKTNFFINGLLELLQMKRNQNLECKVCSTVQRSVLATSRCLDCKDFLCQPCSQGHCCSRLTLHHKVVGVEEFLAGNYDSEVRFLQELWCQSHPEEALRFFCDTCSMSICRDCRMLDHFQHKVVSMSSAVQRERPLVEQLTKTLQGTIASISEQEKAVEKAADHLKAEGKLIKEKICKYVEDVTTYICAQKESALAELDALLTKRLEVFHLARKELQIQKDKAVNTQEFSQCILCVGKDYEILHLEGMIRNRVEELQTYQLQELPSQVPELVIAWGEPQHISKAPVFSYVFPEEQSKRDVEQKEQGNMLVTTPRGEGEEMTEAASNDNENSSSSGSETDLEDFFFRNYRIRAEYSYSFKTSPHSVGKSNITGIAIMPHTGQVLLLDKANDKINLYGSGGHYERSIPLPDSDFDFCGICVCGRKLVCSSGNCLFFLTLDGLFERKLKLRGSETSYALASYKNSYVAVSEGTLCTISLYNPFGRCIDRVEPIDYDDGKFLFIAINTWEEFVVSDVIKKQIVILEKSGRVLRLLTSATSLLSSPFSVCVDGNRNIFVVDQHKVICFSPHDEMGEVALTYQRQRPRVLAVNANHLIVVRGDGNTNVYSLV